MRITRRSLMSALCALPIAGWWMPRKTITIQAGYFDRIGKQIVIRAKGRMR